MSKIQTTVWFDHFVVGIKDLDEGINAFATMTGVRPILGGEHPTLGTHNALVSLGDQQYFEILAPRAGARVAAMFEAVNHCDTLVPIRWAVATNDIHQLHRTLASSGYRVNAVTAGSRLTNDGAMLRWNMFTANDERLANGPFFIEWDATTRHPSVAAPTGCVLKSFELVTPDSAVIGKILADVGYPVQVVEGQKRMTIRLDTPKGVVTLAG